MTGHDPLLAGDRAPTPRTLIDIFLETVDRHGTAPALDAAGTVLTYNEFHERAVEVAASITALGIGAGDKVGVRVPSGTADLYVAIMGILMAGAAYVPVDADDPDERARTVFAEASVAAIITSDLVVTSRLSAQRDPIPASGPDLDDDC